MMRRGHRKTVHNESSPKAIDVPETTEKIVAIKKQTTIFEQEKTGKTELTFKVDSVRDVDSTIALTSLGTVEEDSSISLIPEESPAAKGWKEASRQDELVQVITNVFPEYPDMYVIGRGMEARGYHVSQDGSVLIVNGKKLNRVALEDIDFFVFPADTEDTVAGDLDMLVNTRQKLDGSYPFSETGHLRTFILGIVGDSGQVYGMRVQYINLNNPKDRVHRYKDNERGRKIHAAWDEARQNPKYQRKNLNRLEFEVGDIYG